MARSVRWWLLALLAILVGNALYFWALVPVLPSWLVHQPFRLDLGLVLDFICCVAAFAILRTATVRQA